jgi:predicted RND superfamily exporter protein
VHRLRDILVLIAVALLAAAGGAARAGLRVDVENASMKSRGTAHAEAAARAERAHGSRHTVLVLAEPRAEGVDARRWHAGERGFASALRELEDVERVVEVPLADRTAALLAVDVAAADDGRYADAVLVLRTAALAAAPPTHKLSFSGFPVGELAVAEALAAEQAWIVPWIVGALVLLLFIVYRDLRLALGAVLPSLAAILMLALLQSALDHALDPISSLLAPVLLTVGVAGSVHLVERFRVHARESESEVREAVRAAFRDLVVPASLAVATTMAGFLGLLASPIPAVQRFGWLAALGVGLACAVAWVALPPWLRLTMGSGAAGREPAPAWAVLGPGLAVWLRRRAGLVTGVAVVLAFLCGVTWSRLRVDTDPIGILAVDHPFRVATSRVAARTGGVDTVDLLLEPPLPALPGPRAAALQFGLGEPEGIAGPAGPIHTGADGSRLVPLLVRGEEFRQDPDRTVAAVEERAHAFGFPAATVTGPAVIRALDSAALVAGQIEGLLFTLVFLWLAMAIGFRSLRLATLGLIPNLLPCLCLYGALGAFGRPLSVGTAMIGSVLLGVAVDDTIHVLHGYAHARRRGRGRTTSMARALSRSGRALCVTSFVLAAGFGVGAFGELETTKEFGLAAAATILTALVADLVVLPAVLFLAAASPLERRSA